MKAYPKHYDKMSAEQMKPELISKHVITSIEFALLILSLLYLQSSLSQDPNTFDMVQTTSARKSITVNTMWGGGGGSSPPLGQR